MFHRINVTGYNLLSKDLSIAFYLILISFLILPQQACKKENGFDSKSVTLSQLKGTWRGRITTFKNNTRIEKSGDVSFYPNATGNLLDGIFELGQVNFLDGFMFQSGILYFNLICSDSTNPQCANWDLGGYVYLQEDNLMVIRIAGNECGPKGSEFVTYEGYLILVNPEMDPSLYFSFPQAGRSWRYKTTRFDSIICTIQQEVINVPSPYVFNMRETNDCGWPFFTREFSWYVEPFKLSILNDSSTTDILYTYYLDAVINKKYRFINGADTTFLTLTKADVPVNTTAGSFRCGKYAIDSRIHSSGNVNTKGTIYLSKQYGFIKMEYSEPSDSSNILSKVADTINFQ